MIEINDLIGVPYKDHGRDLDGLDCYGLALEVMRRYGKHLDDVVYNDHSLSLSDKYAPTLNVTSTDTPAEGVLVEMEYKNSLHIGVCLNNREVIHATKTGVRVSPISILKIRGLYICQ